MRDGAFRPRQDKCKRGTVGKRGASRRHSPVRRRLLLAPPCVPLAHWVLTPQWSLWRRLFHRPLGSPKPNACQLRDPCRSGGPRSLPLRGIDCWSCGEELDVTGDTQRCDPKAENLKPDSRNPPRHRGAIAVVTLPKLLSQNRFFVSHHEQMKRQPEQCSVKAQ
jgi:hypothetical protein